MTLEERKARAKKTVRIDNADLPAGSGMIYYCVSCGLTTEVLPEDWWERRPHKYCDECVAEGLGTNEEVDEEEVERVRQLTGAKVRVL